MALSKSEVDIFINHINKIPENGAFEPNLYYDREAYEVCSLIDHRIWDAERYPGKAGRLDRVRAAHKNRADRNLFVARQINNDPETMIGFYESGARVSVENSSFSVTGFAAILQGFWALDMTIVVIDQDKFEFVNIKPLPITWSASDVYAEINANFNSQETSGRYLIMLDASWDPKDNSAPRRVQGRLTSGIDMHVSDDPVITAPIRTSDRPLDPDAISIGLGRPYNDWGPGSEMDYAWNQPGENNPRGMIPFVGSARFDDRIKPLEPERNFIVSMSVVNTFGGGGYFPITPLAMQNIYSGFRIDQADPMTLNWNFSPGSAGNPVVFDHINWPSDMHAIFFFRALVFLESGLPAQITVRSHPGTPQNPPDGHLPILPIRFVWHCVAQETMVLMADGSEKPIEKIVAGDIIYSDLDLGETVVLWTTKGAHHGPVYEFTTEGGHKVICTSNHVLVTEHGMAYAHEIQRGSSLLYHDPSSPEHLKSSILTQISRIDGYSGLMYNLGIDYIDKNDRSARFFFGNGIYMGDASADQVLMRQRKNDLAYLKSALPAVFHTDLESHFQDFK